MSELTKKPHMDDIAYIHWRGNDYAIPVSILKKYQINQHEKALSIHEVFGDLLSETSESGLVLQGVRHKEGLTQLQFANLIGVTQANLSAMENGRRAIGKRIAKRLEARFGVDYRLFL